MNKHFSGRVKAVVVAAAMIATAASTSLAAVTTAYAEYSSSILKSLATSDNIQECTYMCALRTSDYTLWTDSNANPSSIISGTESDYLMFHFQLPEEYYNDYVISQFVWYFGCSADETVGAKGYWYGMEDYFDTICGADVESSVTEEGVSAVARTYTNEVDVVAYIGYSGVDISDDEYSWEDHKFQIQNCYTEIINEDDKMTTIQAVPIELVSVEYVSGFDAATPDADDETKSQYGYQEGELGPQNTGGLWYSSIMYNLNINYGSSSFDGKTFTSVNTLQLDTEDIVEIAETEYNSSNLILTPGQANSEEDYVEYDTDGDGVIGEDIYGNPEGYDSEGAVREAGLPVNSHKFYYSEFELNDGNNASNVNVKSISVTFQATNPDVQTITRFSYGGGVNVEGLSPADSNHAYAEAGIIDETDSSYNHYLNEGSYWYNSVGSDKYEEILAWQEANPGEYVYHYEDGSEFEIESGTSLENQNLGTYFTVTWDVPESVMDYTTSSNTDSISFQVWYAEGEDKDGNKLTSNDDLGGFEVVEAYLTYEETEDFPLANKSNLTVKSSTSSKTYTGTVGNSVSIPYSDLLTQGVDYENIADVYAIEADVKLNTADPKAVYGAGTSCLEPTGSGEYWEGNWYELDDMFDLSSLAFLNFTETTKDTEVREDNTDYEAVAAQKESSDSYHFSWIVPQPLKTKVSTEYDEDNFSFGVWWAETATSYTISNVTIYYIADDASNQNKTELIEGYFWVYPEEMTISNVDGTTYIVETDEDGNAVYDEYGNVVIVGDAIIETGHTCTVSKSGFSRELNSCTSDDGGLTWNLDARENYQGGGTLTFKTDGGQTATTVVTIVVSYNENYNQHLGEDDTEDTGDTTTEVTVSTEDDSSNTNTETTTTSVKDHNLTGMYGDVNLDDNISIADAVLLCKYVNSKVTFNEQQILNANVQFDLDEDGNDIIDLQDLNRLMRFQVRLENTLGPDEFFQ